MSIKNIKLDILYFLLGVSWGILFLGALFFFKNPVFLYLGSGFLLLCLLPGVIFVIIFSLLIDNFILKRKLEDKK